MVQDLATATFERVLSGKLKVSWYNERWVLYAASMGWRHGMEAQASHPYLHLQLTVQSVFPLEEVAKAHELLEGRGTTGKLLLKP